LNFFGHAVVAGWQDIRASHLLGSMLPDFETMIRVPLIEVRNPDIRRGIELHHRTDDAFHRAPAFLALCAHALGELTEAGVRRGTARAVGHIGSEMFLDASTTISLRSSSKWTVFSDGKTTGTRSRSYTRG
jgi:hypothetical protein